MEESTASLASLTAASKQVAQRLLTIGENRLALLAVEVQEERERLLQAVVLALGTAVLAFLAGLTLTAGLVVLVWPYSPIAVLLTLTGLYGGSAFLLYRRLAGLLRNWQVLSASLGQLRKDRACLEKILG
jgi:uncharacterized membrane protein YqjE